MDSNFEEEDSSQQRRQYSFAPFAALLFFLAVGYLGVSYLDKDTNAFFPSKQFASTQSALTNSLFDDPCDAPGVVCTFDKGIPTPVGECINPVGFGTFLNCKHQRAIAEKQITSGIGKPAPKIERLEYTSQQCFVVTTVGSGQCYEEATETCATAHANDVTECFWDNCPGSCKEGVFVVDDVSSGNINTDGSTVEGIIDDLGGGNSTDQFIRPDGSLDIASCAEAGVCTNVASNDSGVNMATDAVFSDDVSSFSESSTRSFSAAPVSENDIFTETAFESTAVDGRVFSRDIGSPFSGDSTVTNPLTRITSLETPQISGAGAESLAVETGSTEATYESLQPSTESTSPERSSVQNFAWDAGLINRLANFITKSVQIPIAPRAVAQEVVIIEEAVVSSERKSSFNNIQVIASDIAAQTPAGELTRVDHFAEILSRVGGPNEVDVENKAYGRIQDLIVEDEAIRALRKAEEAGKRAKDSIFCRVLEASEDCQLRREAKAKEVERQVFLQELEDRILPTKAIEHFLAVYDGWIRPGRAPSTFATSTLGVLHDQDNQLADYERETNGSTFVLWIIESISEATAKAVDVLSDLLFNNEEKA